jgi:hypothetical protein
MMRYKYLQILVLFSIIVSCTAKEEGIIVSQQKLKIFADADTLSKNVGMLKPGEWVEILDTTSYKYSIGTYVDSCNMYPMIKVSTKLGKSGWLFGKYVFRIGSKYEPKYKINSDLEIKFQGETYSIHYGKNYGIGSFSSEGLTGCEDFYPIILFNKNKQTYYIIKNIKNPITIFPYSILNNDAAVGQEITEAKSTSERIILSVKCTYQEGTGSYDYAIKKIGDEFSGESFNYKQVN